MTTAHPALGADALAAHTAFVRRLARRLTGDDDEADDLTQETLLAATLHPPAADRPLRPWLFVVLRNHFFKRRQALRRRAARERAHSMQEIATPEALLAEVQRGRLLAELALELAEPYRQTLLLRYHEGRSAAEIARALGIPAGTVRWRLKTAVEELRRRLDQRAGGRAAWMAALAPLARDGDAASTAPLQPRAAPRWLAPLALVAAGLTLVAVVLLAVRSSRSPTPPPAALARPASGSLGAPPDHPGGRRRDPTDGSPTLAAVAAPDGLPACQSELRRLRVEAAVAEREWRQRLGLSARFAIGAPNPLAEQALAPDIERLLSIGAATAPSYTLECRTWACRLLVLQTREELARNKDWHRPLERDASLDERVSQLGLTAVTPTRDPISGAALSENSVFLALRDPSGARVGDRPLPPPTPDARPLPTSARACADVLAGLRAEVARWRQETAARRQPHERFATSPPNPGLARVFGDKLRASAAVTGPAAGSLTAECHGLVCRVRWPDAVDRNWHNQLDRESWFRTMVDGTMVGRELYFTMAPGSRADGVSFLEQLLDGFRATGAVDACHARFPATGTLEARFRVPRTGPGAETDEDVPRDRISVQYGGTLAGTPTGKCLEDEIARTVLATPLPSPAVSGAEVYRRYRFPPEPGR